MIKLDKDYKCKVSVYDLVNETTIGVDLALRDLQQILKKGLYNK